MSSTGLSTARRSTARRNYEGLVACAALLQTLLPPTSRYCQKVSSNQGSIFVTANGGGFGANSVTQSGHVPNCVQPPLVRVARDRSVVTLQRWYVVDANDANEIDISVGTHAGEHVRLAMVVEGL